MPFRKSKVCYYISLVAFLCTFGCPHPQPTNSPPTENPVPEPTPEIHSTERCVDYPTSQCEQHPECKLGKWHPDICMKEEDASAALSCDTIAPNIKKVCFQNGGKEECIRHLFPNDDCKEEIKKWDRQNQRVDGVLNCAQNEGIKIFCVDKSAKNFDLNSDKIKAATRDCEKISDKSICNNYEMVVSNSSVDYTFASDPIYSYRCLWVEYCKFVAINFGYGRRIERHRWGDE